MKSKGPSDRRMDLKAFKTVWEFSLRGTYLPERGSECGYCVLMSRSVTKDLKKTFLKRLKRL